MSPLHTRLRRTVAAAALSLASALALGVTAVDPATAGPSAGPTKIATGQLAPLSVAVADDGTVYYASAFAGVLFERAPGEAAVPIFTSPGERPKEVGSISVDGDVVYFTHGAKLMRIDGEGNRAVLADLGAYEREMNPDRGVTYGFRDVGKRCLATWPTKRMGLPGKYRGIVEAHPYATEVVDGTVYVADAAANVIYAYDNNEVDVAALIEPRSFRMTRGQAKGLGIDPCFAGHRYWVEGVPTDVEAGPDGRLWFTSLPGGPGVAPLGSVRTLDLETGAVRTKATGLADATGLDVTDAGVAYVTQLFRGVVTRIVDGVARTWLEIKQPAALEIQGDSLYLTTNVLSGLEGGEPNGRVLRYEL